MAKRHKHPRSFYFDVNLLLDNDTQRKRGRRPSPKRLAELSHGQIGHILGLPKRKSQYLGKVRAQAVRMASFRRLPIVYLTTGSKTITSRQARSAAKRVCEAREMKHPSGIW